MTDASPQSRALVLVGAVTCIFWLSRAVYPVLIPPLAPMPDFTGLLKEISPWIREMVPSLNKPDAEVMARLRREAMEAYAVQWAFIAAGLVSGILIALRRRVGRRLAIALSAGLLAWLVISDALVAIAEPGATPWRLWKIMAQAAPSLAIRRWVDVAFYVVTLVALTRRRLRRAFVSIEDQEPAR